MLSENSASVCGVIGWRTDSDGENGVEGALVTTAVERLSLVAVDTAAVELADVAVTQLTLGGVVPVRSACQDENKLGTHTYEYPPPFPASG